MRILKELFLKDWQFKLLALFMSISLWLLLTFGQRVSVVVDRYVKIENAEPNLEYRLDRRRVKIRLSIVERAVSEEDIEKVSAFVDVRGLQEGEFVLKVQVRTPMRFIIEVERVEPEYVRVKVVKSPQRGQ